jgi:hypothetical protein
MRRRARASLLLLMSACATGSSTTSSGVTTATVVSATSGAVGGSDVAPARAANGEAVARIARLKRSFECTDVPTQQAFVCTMKDGMVGSLVGKRIEPVVTSNGTLSLRSVYRDRDWIYHDHVVVRVGDEEFRSAVLPATSPDVSRREIRRDVRRGSRVRDDYVDETVSYRRTNDNGIIRAIAGAGERTVTMQLAGGPRHFEKALSDDEKRLFREAVELAQLLRAQAETRR